MSWTFTLSNQEAYALVRGKVLTDEEFQGDHSLRRGFGVAGQDSEDSTDSMTLRYWISFIHL